MINMHVSHLHSLHNPFIMTSHHISSRFPYLISLFSFSFNLIILLISHHILSPHAQISSLRIVLFYFHYVHHMELSYLHQYLRHHNSSHHFPHICSSCSSHTFTSNHITPYHMGSHHGSYHHSSYIAI